jgi:hypothetical protein
VGKMLAALKAAAQKCRRDHTASTLKDN